MDLRAQLAAQQAETDAVKSTSLRATAAREVAAPQPAEAEAAQLAIATTASLNEAAALEAQLTALHAAAAPTPPPGGDPYSHIADSLARLEKHLRVHLAKPAHGAADVKRF